MSNAEVTLNEKKVISWSYEYKKVWTMEEKDILLKTIEGLNTSMTSLSTTNKNQSEQIKNLQERIKELTDQVAWLNRQLFGRKSEKLRIYDPNIPDLIADEFSGLRQQVEEKQDEAVEKIEKGAAEVRKQNRQNRKMIEDLPVPESETMEPKGVEIAPMPLMPVDKCIADTGLLPRYCFRSMNIMFRSTVRYNSTAILE